MKKTIIISLFIIVTSSTCNESRVTPKYQIIDSPTNSLLQSISIIDNNTAWISGHNGEFIRTLSGGDSWELFSHPTGDTLQFRDVHGVDSNTAVLMSAGPGPLSRIFTFTYPNQWEENFVMQDSTGFLDCIDFWNDQKGIAYGDAIDNYPYILLTSNGGKSWERADTTDMPLAGSEEGGFAASGTCVTTAKNGKAWIATGASGNCRFLITEDYGTTWKSVDSPLVTGEAAGNTSISFEGKIGVVTGGDLLKPSEYTNNCAFTKDSGDSWKLTTQPNTPGAFYGSAISAVNETVYAWVCGPNGIDYTKDMGQTWETLDTLNYWAISVKGNVGYASGTDGKILKISLQP